MSSGLIRTAVSYQVALTSYVTGTGLPIYYPNTFDLVLDQQGNPINTTNNTLFFNVTLFLIPNINGTNYVNTSIATNGATTYSFSTYGSANIGSTGQGYTGVYFDINLF
jgi:hypothetical protein